MKKYFLVMLSTLIVLFLSSLKKWMSHQKN